jgi:hypothetical protein
MYFISCSIDEQVGVEVSVTGQEATFTSSQRVRSGWRRSKVMYPSTERICVAVII